MKKPKYYLKPWKKDDNHCIDKDDWNIAREYNAKPVRLLESSNLSFLITDPDDLDFPWRVSERHLTQRLFIEEKMDKE